MYRVLFIKIEEMFKKEQKKLSLTLNIDPKEV